MGNRSKAWCAILWSLCLLFQQVQGASELSRAGIVSGGGVGSAGQYQVLTSIGQPYATALLQGNTSSGGSGLLAGLENSPVSDLAGQLKGNEDQLLVMNHAQLLSLLNAYDPDGDAITVRVEPLVGIADLLMALVNDDANANAVYSTVVDAVSQNPEFLDLLTEEHRGLFLQDPKKFLTEVFDQSIGPEILTVEAGKKLLSIWEEVKSTTLANMDEDVLNAIDDIIRPDSLNLTEGGLLSWQPPLHDNGSIDALRVSLHDERLGNEIVALITVNIDAVPYQVLFLEEPGGGFANTYPALHSKVRIADRKGVTVGGAENVLFYSIAAGTGTPGASLSGAIIIKALDGMAEYDEVMMGLAGTDYQLIASSPGLVSATSSVFDIIEFRSTTTQGGGYPSNLNPTINIANAPISSLGSSGSILVSASDVFPDTAPTLITSEDAPRGADPGRFEPGHEPVATNQAFTGPADTSLEITLDVTDPKKLGLTLEITDYPDHGRIDELVYSAGSSNQEFYFPMGTEIGDEILPGTMGRRLTDFEFELWSAYRENDNPAAVLKIYNNDGNLAEGGSGQRQPGTVLYESDAVVLTGGFQTVSLEDINIDVSSSLTWSVKFSGLSGASNSRAGLVYAGDPVVGESYDNYWEKTNGAWELKKTGSGVTLKNNFKASVYGYNKTSTSLTYVPDAGYAGADDFSYRIADWFNFTDTATVTIEVTDDSESPSEGLGMPKDGGVNRMIGLLKLTSPKKYSVFLSKVVQKPFGFDFNTRQGKMYAVESSTDLVQWQTVHRMEGTGGTARFTERSTPSGIQFYRVNVVE